MATTEQYGLTLPEEGDAFDIADFNGNFETIDTLMAENETAVNEVNEKLGTPPAGETVFSLLQGGGSLIRSIQRFSISRSITSDEPTVQSISTVNPDKCIVLMDYLYDRSSGMAEVEYALAEDSLTITTNGSTNGTVQLKFQIAEFY